MAGRVAAAEEAGGSALQVVPIYAALPPEQQARVFEPAPDGDRKVYPWDTHMRRMIIARSSCVARPFRGLDLHGPESRSHGCS